jgi:hypothetical protein
MTFPLRRMDWPMLCKGANSASIRVELLGFLPLWANMRSGFARTTQRRTGRPAAGFQARSELHGWHGAQAPLVPGFGPGRGLRLRLHLRKLHPVFGRSQNRNASRRADQYRTLYRSCPILGTLGTRSKGTQVTRESRVARGGWQLACATAGFLSAPTLPVRAAASLLSSADGPRCDLQPSRSVRAWSRGSVERTGSSVPYTLDR